MGGWGSRFLNLRKCENMRFFSTKTSRNAMKHVILSLKMKGDVISGQSLMLWFQKDSLDIVGFGTFRVGSGFPKLLRSIFPLCES